MNCPNCNTHIPDDLVRRDAARLNGQAGRGKAKARTSEQARKAAMAGVRKRRRIAKTLTSNGKY